MGGGGGGGGGGGLWGAGGVATPWSGPSPVQKAKRPRSLLQHGQSPAPGSLDGAPLLGSQPLGSQDFLRCGLGGLPTTQEEASPAAARHAAAATPGVAPGGWRPKRKVRSPPCHRNAFLAAAESDSTQAVAPPPGFSLSQQQQSTSVYKLLFRELELLGKGSSSRVYRAQHRLDGADYAIKRSARRLRSRGDLREALQEVHALRAVGQHPHITPYYTCWVEEDTLYVQLGLCTGGSLAQHFLGGQGKAFTEAELRSVLRCTAAALAHVHARGLCHLDVKPDNIYAHEGAWVLGDLGMASCRKSPGSGTDRTGDARYLAPEQLNPEQFGGTVDGACVDVFSLGVALYELASGKGLPPTGCSSLRQGRVPLLPGLTTRFHDLLASMLQVNPEKRPTAQDLLSSPVLQDLAPSPPVRDPASAPAPDACTISTPPSPGLVPGSCAPAMEPEGLLSPVARGMAGSPMSMCTA